VRDVREAVTLGRRHLLVFCGCCDEGYVVILPQYTMRGRGGGADPGRPRGPKATATSVHYASSPRRRSPPSPAARCASRRAGLPRARRPPPPPPCAVPASWRQLAGEELGGERGGRRRRRASGERGCGGGVSGEKEEGAESPGAPIGLGFSPGRLFIWTQ
jgi:hypothetical protein